MSATVLLGLVVVAIRAAYTFPLDYNEGWNLYFQQRASTGLHLYNADNAWTPCIYPPLSLFLVGAMGRLLGAPLLVARTVSVSALLAVAALAYFTLLRLRLAALEAALAALFLCGVFLTYAPHYVGMNDPQLLGHVFQLAALYLYVRAPGRLGAISALLALSLFVKHNLLPLPLALVCSSALDGRRALAFLGRMLGCLALLTALTLLLCGRDFLGQVTAAREYSLANLTRDLQHYGHPLWLVPGAGLAYWCARACRSSTERPIALYLAFALPWGLFTLGAAGAGVNMVFDVFIAGAMAVGLALAQLRAWSKLSGGTVAWSLFATIAIRFPFARPTRLIAEYRHSEQAFLAQVEYVKAHRAPVLCQSLAVCYFAGQGFEYEPFGVRHRILTGQAPEAPLLALIESKHFRLLQLVLVPEPKYFEGPLGYGKVMKNDGFTENFFIALGRHYRLARVSGPWAYLEPK